MSHAADADTIGERDVNTIVTDISHLQFHALNLDGAHSIIVIANPHTEYDVAVKVIEEQIDIILALAVVIEAEGSTHGIRLVTLAIHLTNTRHNTIVLCSQRGQLLDMEHGAIVVPVGNAVCKCSIVRHIAI